jgi:glycyl-tRNA synthetase beta subunit
MIEDQALQNMFTYHAPKGDQADRYQRIREIALVLARTINDCCPDSADKTAAIRKLREAVMTANASIAVNE